MGKRELLIICGFIVAGAVAYQLTAQPREEGGGSFSLAALMEHFRREARSNNRATASVTTHGIIAAPQHLREARISSIRHVTVTGEARTDIAYELTIESNGPDDATAREFATRTNLSEDSLGPILSVRANSPKDVRQVATLSLTIPARLSVRIEGTGGGTTVRVIGTAGVQLDGIVGDVRLTGITGDITGSQRNGELSVSESESVELTVAASKVELDRIRGAITLGSRNGRCRITGATGPIELESTNEDLRIEAPGGTVRVRGNGGTIAVNDPKSDVNVDVRRATVEVTLARPVPLTLLTTDAPLRLRLTGPPAVNLDAVATDGGAIEAGEFSLTPETIEQETRLRHAFGSAAVTVSLRNRRAPIVISRMK